MMNESSDLDVFAHHHSLQQDVPDFWFPYVLAHSVSDLKDMFHDMLDLFLLLLAGLSDLVVPFKTVIDGFINDQIAVKYREKRITVELGKNQINV